MRLRTRIHARAGRPLALLALLLPAAALLACAPAAEEMMEPAATTAGVEEAFTTFVEAWESEDVEAVLATFTADAVVFDPVPPGKFSGAEAIRGLVTNTFEMQEQISIPVSEVEVSTHGPVAWSSARYTYESRMEGEMMAEDGYVSMVWVLQDDGSYRATLFHASPIPVEEMEAAS